MLPGLTFQSTSGGGFISKYETGSELNRAKESSTESQLTRFAHSLNHVHTFLGDAIGAHHRHLN